MADRSTSKRADHFWAALAVILAASASGCLSLDYTPLENQRFYRDALRIREGLSPPPAVSGPLLAGSARAEITPPAGYPLAGYGGRRSTGVHDPVYARSLVMSNGHTTVAVLSADVLAMTDDLSEEIIHHIQRKVPIPAENILVTATHTHSGPGALGKRFWEQLAAGPFRPGYFDWTARQMADSVISAYERLEPSTLTSYRFNAPDLVANRVIVDGPEDPELQVLVLQSNDGSATTYLVNFAAHPTVLRSRNRLVSGDFPGFLSSALEENEGTVALYTSGALGELKAQPPEGAGVFERAERMGRAMSRRILENRPGGEGKSFVKLSSTKIRIPLPPTHPKISIQRRLPGWIGRFFFDGVTLLQVLRVDDTFLIGIPGDLGSEIGAAWKAKVRQMEKNAFILSFSNDYVGYIMPFYYYNQPTHESAMSFNGPYMADYLGMFVEPLILQ